VTVQLDELVQREVPVTVDPGTIPDGLGIGTTIVDPSTVIVSGPASVVGTVVAAQAAPVIQASGLSVDQDLALTAIDRLGDPVSPVKLEPDTARVQIQVFPNVDSRTITIGPVVTGTPASGFEVATITVVPTAVTVKGDAERLAALESIETEPVSVSGASKTVEATVGLAPPDGVAPIDADTVRVTVTFRPVNSTRAFEVGFRYVGDDIAFRYSIPTDRVLVTIGGSVADLDRLSGVTLVLSADVTGLDVGSHSVPVSANLATGLTLVAASPNPIEVTVSTGAASPTPSAAPSPTP
jgi:YbbR domain-containing protein